MNPLLEYTHAIRVRYCETDAQGRLHHAHYLNYFELGRTEMLRAAGMTYREFEESGLMLVVKEMKVQYHLGAQYDDLLQLTTRTVKAKGARIVHHYELRRDEELIATGESTVACIRRDGRVARLPEAFLME